LTRHLRERGRVIRIGHKWARGGADSIARALNVTLLNCWKKIIVEGDAKGFDQSVRELFVNLYFSTMGVHFDKSSPDYPAFEKIVKFLLKNMIDRITHLFGELWAIIHGGVPSGAYNTSHMDSWIMALYFCLFMVYQVMTAPVHLQEDLEEYMLQQLYLVVYGDDHLYNKGEGNESVYFSGTIFAKFMLDHFDVEIRDLKDGISFCSQHRNGYITRMGATFLKYQFVVNENRSVGQPDFLPFRETREYIVRAVWARETRPRDAIDVILSILGQVYGTYGSNRDAYDRLRLLYEELIFSMDSIEDLQKRLANRIGHDEIKKLRQAGVTAEELTGGFPLWETLQKKNIVDKSYQENTIYPVDYNDVLEVFIDTDFF